jgi:hypothetical protein
LLLWRLLNLFNRLRRLRCGSLENNNILFGLFGFLGRAGASFNDLKLLVRVAASETATQVLLALYLRLLSVAELLKKLFFSPLKFLQHLLVMRTLSFSCFTLAVVGSRNFLHKHKFFLPTLSTSNFIVLKHLIVSIFLRLPQFFASFSDDCVMHFTLCS